MRISGRHVVISLFLTIAGFTLAKAVDEAGTAASEGTLDAWLVAGYASLQAVIALTFALFVLRRSPPRRRTRDPLAFAACAAAMASVTLLRPPGASASTSLVIVGESLTVLACIWMLASALALGTCFGILPEARGLVMRGPYRVVRHPIYLGELTAFAGLIVASPRPLSFVGAFVFASAQAIRMRLEERALRTEFPEYDTYAARTSRLIPGLAGPIPQADPR